MNVPMSYDLDRYYEVATARALAVANGLSFTSTINPGAWYKGVFYHGSKELIITHTGNDIPSELAKDWKNLQTVKVLESPVSNLKYMLPDGRRHNVEAGLAVISIDIPCLMVQYRQFLIEQNNGAVIEGDNRTGENIGTRHFVGKYVLPNMLYSQTDLAIHRRLFNLLSGAPMGDSLQKHPFFISDYTELLDKGLLEILERVSVTKMRYRDVLEQIPKVFSGYPLRMPDLAETRQVWWALFLTRLDAIRFLFDVGGEEGRHYNAVELNALKIDLKRLKSENVLKAKLPPDTYGDVQYELNRMFALL